MSQWGATRAFRKEGSLLIVGAHVATKDLWAPINPDGSELVDDLILLNVVSAVSGKTTMKNDLLAEMFRELRHAYIGQPYSQWLKAGEKPPAPRPGGHYTTRDGTKKRQELP